MIEKHLFRLSRWNLLLKELYTHGHKLTIHLQDILTQIGRNKPSFFICNLIVQMENLNHSLPLLNSTETDCSDDVMQRVMLEQLHRQ